MPKKSEASALPDKTPAFTNSRKRLWSGKHESEARRGAGRPQTGPCVRADALDTRSSSIYRNRPRYFVFGVGSYSFAPWRVAISGIYKQLAFRSVPPVNGSPVVLDDTCYFIPCENEDEANYFKALLNSEAASGFFRYFVFWDTRRPITASLLASLDIGLLAEEHGGAIAPKQLRTTQAALNL